MSRRFRGKPRRYWDTCIFLAWIKGESIWPEEVMKGIEQTADEAYAGRVVIITSVITLTEFEQTRLTPDQRDKFQKLFTHPNWQLMDVDKRVAAKAAVIRQHYDTRVYDKNGNKVSGGFMSLGDSLHLATALHFGVSEFQTLDGAGKHTKRMDP